MTSVDVQVAVLLVTVLLGSAVGLAYDLYRGLRRAAIRSRAATAVGDLLFWSLATLFVFRGLVFGNGGELRMYVFAGTAAGLYLYFQLASPTVMWTVAWFWRAVFALARLVATGFRAISRGLAASWSAVAAAGAWAKSRVARILPAVRLPWTHRDDSKGG
ncbi:MAG: spore cortex biosynthesis protein YabQ [Bacillota bacterium]